MAREFIQIPTGSRQNVNRPHRIALKTQWQVSTLTDSSDPTSARLCAFRTFHRPTGLAEDQAVQFCFQPAPDDVAFLLNSDFYPFNIANGLASAPITDIMRETNRVEIRWRFNPDNNSSIDIPKLPEHFVAWLEISEETALD